MREILEMNEVNGIILELGHLPAKAILRSVGEPENGALMTEAPLFPYAAEDPERNDDLSM